MFALGHSFCLAPKLPSVQGSLETYDEDVGKWINGPGSLTIRTCINEIPCLVEGKLVGNISPVLGGLINKLVVLE
jgi:hypothetical protein